MTINISDDTEPPTDITGECGHFRVVDLGSQCDIAADQDLPAHFLRVFQGMLHTFNNVLWMGKKRIESKHFNFQHKL